MNEQVITISPPEPHSKKQKLIMSAFKIPGLREVWVAMGTKFGKSIGASSGLATAAIEEKNKVWRWVAPIYSQAEIGLDYFRRILPPEPHTEINKSNLVINLPFIESRIELWHAKHSQSLEGAGVSGYVFDEAAKIEYDVYASARTTTTRTLGPMMFISTPVGKNHFYSGCMDAKDHMTWALKNNKSPEKIFITAKTEDNPYIPRESIENAKAELPSRLFRQYYMAEFIDDGTVFGGFRQCIYGPELDLEGDSVRWFHEDISSMNVVIGVDWAKSNDRTVFIAINEKGYLVAFERFYKTPYTEAIRKLCIFVKKFNEVHIVYHDKTGVGDAIDDQLAYTDLPVQGVVFTNKNKAEMVAKLITTFEQKLMFIPNWPTMISELDFYEVKTSSSGLMSYSAPDGKHDDIVSALMLAHAAWIKFGNCDIDVRYLEDLKDGTIKEDAISAFYKELAEDDEDF